jgi:antitoxin YefM
VQVHRDAFVSWGFAWRLRWPYSGLADAGWSSSVARWAHNPEVAGSNPAPATKSGTPSNYGRGLSRSGCYGSAHGPLGLTASEILVKLLTMTTLPLGEVKSHLSELVSRVHDHHERVTVTVHGRPSAVLVAVDDLDRLEESLAIMRDTDTLRRLAESDAELARGEEVSAYELAEAIGRRQAHE